MQKSNVDFYPVLLLSILADTLLRLHTGYWARAGLLALPASAAVLAAVLLLVSTSWQGNALLQKVLCVLLAISSALEILRLHALFGSVYPGTLGLAGTCFVVLAPVIYLRREPALRQTANALLVFGAACMAIMVLSVAPRLRVPNLHAAPLTGQDWQAAVTAMHHSKICSHSSRLKIESAPHCAAPCTGVWRVGMAAPKNSSSSRWTAASNPSADAANVTALRQRWPGCGGQRANSRYSGGSAS